MITEAEAVLIIALLVALIASLITVANLLVNMKKDNREQHLAMKVIVNDLINIVEDGKDESSEQGD